VRDLANRRCDASTSTDVALEAVDHRTFDGRLQMMEFVPKVRDGPPV
jgi:hypothetical protein